MPFVPKSARVTSEELKTLEAQHGRVATVRDDAYPNEGEEIPAGAVAWEVVVRKAKAPEWKLFRKQSTTEGVASEAGEWLSRVCVVRVAGAPAGSDARAAFDSLLEEWPGIPERLANIISKLSGFDMDKRGNG